ncbi:winged helix-turn-helix transcriptional regulator [Aeromicrobium sp. UC242_57]|uniref:winged helix-turn-helix transcriptional regulator n=1 Tax=Aeromicrobium sp. UC242_57 TaxID=3374624 RepID=UPI003788DE06
MPMQLAGRLAATDRTSPGDHCPVDRAMQVVGTRSAMLLMREAAYGTTRFDEFATRVGISDAIASSRLRELVDAGLLERRPYREPGQRTRHEYVLTESGNDLVPVVLALAEWGRKHAPARWSPRFTHAGCEADVTVTVGCTAGHQLDTEDVVVTG